MNSNNIRLAVAGDRDDILRVAVESGLFEAGETEVLGDMLREYFAGKLEGHAWWVLESDRVLGAVYYAPETFADSVWNLYFIAVAKNTQGQGIGGRLLQHVEQTLTSAGEKTLIVETSSLDSFKKSRDFYKKQGFQEEARIRNWYGPGDAKVTFLKSLG